MDDREARDILIDELRQKRQPRYLARAYECAIKALDDRIPKSVGKTNTRQKKKKEAEVVVKEKTVRLIDANVLVEELEKRIRTPRSTMEIARDIIPLIESQPVAYDLDSVLKELQDQADQYKRRSETEAAQLYVEKYRGKMHSYLNATEIVKRGGVDHE